MGGKGRDLDPCTLEVTRGFIDMGKQKSIGRVVVRCVRELETFTPAQLKACIEQEARIALPYDMFYNKVIRGLLREGLLSKVKRGVYRATDKLKLAEHLTEVLSRPVFESVMHDVNDECVIVKLRLHVVSGSLLEAYTSLLVLRKVLPVALGIVRGALRDGGFGEGELRRAERCVRDALRSVRLLGFYVGGHRGKGRASRELKEGFGFEEHGVDIAFCVEERYLALFRHVNFYRAEVIGDCSCEGGGPHGGEAR
jgi:hypothetical protein